jgi:hypothetical protein
MTILKIYFSEGLKATFTYSVTDSGEDISFTISKADCDNL